MKIHLQFPPDTIFRIGLITMVMLMVFNGIMIKNLYSKNGKRQPLPSTSQLIIYKDTVPALYPHEHEVEDSVFDAGHHVVTFKQITIQEDIWVTGFEFSLKNAPQEVLHHAGIYIPDRPNRICPNALYGEELYPVSSETNTPIVFPEPYGIFLAEGTQLATEVMYHNPFPPFGSGKIYKDVSAAIVMSIQKKTSTGVKKH